MKQRITALSTMLLLFLFAWSTAVMANEHVKVVEWADEDGFVIMNALLDAIAEDIDEDGNYIGPEDRVYQLQANGYYFNTERIESPGPLRIVGEEPGDGDQPAILQNRHADDDSWDETMIVSQNDLELRHLWIVGRTEQGSEGWGLIDIAGDNSTVIIDHVVLEYNLSAVIHNLAPGTDFSMTNSHFRNLIDHSQYWAGRVIRTEAPTSRLFFENNTFFNVGHTIVQVQQTEGELWFNHNTVVNSGRHVLSAEGVQWQRAFIANNMFINGYWHGETEDDFSAIREGEPDNQYGSWISLDYLDPQLGFEDQRRIGILNNAHYVIPEIWDLYDEYPEDVEPDAGAPAEGDVRAAAFLNQRAMDIIGEWENIKFENHLNLIGEDLGLQFYEDGHFDDLFIDMFAWLSAQRAGLEPSEYYWDIDRDPSPSPDPTPSVGQVYPIAENAENFAYTHSGAMSNAVGGYPVGDLNWFPDQKADWEANRDAQEQQIRDMFDAAEELNAVADLEAEDGILDGDAHVVEFDGFEYFHLETGGFTWTFEMEEGGEYGLNVLHNKGNEGDRGQVIEVNGVNLRNNDGFGEYFFPGDQPNNEWLVEEIRNEDLYEGEIVMNEGQNTVTIRASWGWQAFAGFEIVDAGGNVVAEYTIFDSDISASGTLTCLDEPDGAEVDFCPSGGAWVNYGGSGEVGFDLEFKGTGLYNIQFYYMLESGSASADLYVGGDFVEEVFFDEASGSSEVVVASVNIDEGTQGFSLVSDDAALNLDRVMIFTSTDVWLSADDGGTTLPEGFELSQNYPNPFNPTTQIRFEIPSASDVRLDVYNLIGQRVATLVDGFQAEGTHTVQFDGSHLSSGVYIYRLQAGNHTSVRKMTLIK